MQISDRRPSTRRKKVRHGKQICFLNRTVRWKGPDPNIPAIITAPQVLRIRNCARREMRERGRAGSRPGPAVSQSASEECCDQAPRLHHYERGHSVNFISVISRLTEWQLVNEWLSVCTAAASITSQSPHLVMSPLLCGQLGASLRQCFHWHGATIQWTIIWMPEQKRRLPPHNTQHPSQIAKSWIQR